MGLRFGVLDQSADTVVYINQCDVMFPAGWSLREVDVGGAVFQVCAHAAIISQPAKAVIVVPMAIGIVGVVAAAICVGYMITSTDSRFRTASPRLLAVMVVGLVSLPACIM